MALTDGGAPSANVLGYAPATIGASVSVGAFAALTAIFGKLGASTRTEAVRRAMRWGWVEI